MTEKNSSHIVHSSKVFLRYGCTDDTIYLVSLSKGYWQFLNLSSSDNSKHKSCVPGTTQDFVGPWTHWPSLSPRLNTKTSNQMK